MIGFYVCKDEDNSILCEKILNGLDEVPCALIDYLRSIKCHVHICFSPVDGDEYYENLIEKSYYNEESLSV